MTQSQRRLVYAVFCVLSASAILACNSGVGAQSGSGTGAQLSPAPEMNSTFQARNPRTCNGPTSPPNTSEAAALVQCGVDNISTTRLHLAQNVKIISLGPSRAFNMSTDSSMENIDTAARVLPLRGSYTFVSCSQVSDYMQNARKNCQFSEIGNAKGACYKMTSGSYGCFMNGDSVGMPRDAQPGPGTY